MSIALVQQATPANVDTTTATVTLSGVTPGNTLILGVLGSASGTLTITESLSETVNTAIAYAGQAPTFSSVGLYYVTATAGGTVSFTVTFGTGGFLVLFLSEYSGIGTLDAATVVTTNNTASYSSAALTPAGAGELLVSVMALSVNGVLTWNAPFTSLQSNIGSAHANLATALGPTGATSASGTTSLAGHWAIAQAAFTAAAGGATPTVTSVNGGSNIAEGATGIAVVGTNFASGMTADITQPGGVVVSQPFTYTSATNGTFNLSMEPGTGDQLAFTDSTYTTGFDVTVSGATSTPIAVTLVPPTGLIFQTLSSINTTSAYTITATPSLAVGDQLEAAGNSAGTAAAPTGLTLNADATFSFSSGNTPTNFYVRAYDGTNKVWGAWALQTVAVTVTLSPTTLPAATAGTAYSQTLTASGGTSPYTFSVTSGALPAGLSLSSGGVLSGTPTAAGSFSFTVTATDSASHTGSQAYTLTVAANIVVGPSSVGNGVVGVAYSQTLSASDGVSPYTYAVTAGALPTGLSLSSAGAITGTPTTAGTYSFTVTATDASSNTGSQAYSGVTISAAPAFTRRSLGTLGVGS